MLIKLPKQVILLLIRLYQKTLSLDHGPISKIYPQGFCRFYPSCSEYGHQAIEQHGLAHGGWFTLRRLLRCHPLSDGGIDPVPKKKHH